tara:strand:- start:5024 stop:7219 length:2196 start_codon:yes stop_codon:yes gene_type:complete
MERVVDNEISFSRKIKSVILGHWHLSLKHQTLNNGDISRELEPLLFGILVYLIRNNDRVISRQELADEVWKQNYVDDNAINRAMSELRKALKSEKQRAQIIKTHYRVGYSLTVVPEIVYVDVSKPLPKETQASPVLSERKESIDKAKNTELVVSKKSKLFPALLLFLISLLAVAYYLSSRNEPNSPERSPVKVKETLLSWKKGVSKAPLLSKSKRYLAYTFKGSDETSFDLFIKNTETLEEVRLSEDGAQLYPIAWSEKDSLFYQLIDKEAKHPCQVWKVDLVENGMNSDHQKLFDCYGINVLNADTTDNGNTLLYTKFNYRNIPYLSSIVHRDLEKNTEFQVSSPRVSEFGDYFVKVSNSGKKVAILRKQAKGIKILIASKDGSSPREVASLDYVIDAIGWSEDDSQLIWLNRDSSSIASFSIESSDLSYQALDTEAIEGGKIGIDLVDETTVVIATDYADSNLYSLSTSGRQLRDFSNTNRLEITASSLHNKEAIIYLVGWKRQALWRDENGARKKLLDSMPDKKITYMAVAPNDVKFALANKNSIFIYDTESLELEDELSPPGLLSNLSWPFDNTLLVTYEVDDKTNAWLYDLDTKKYVLIAKDVLGAARIVNGNTLVYLNYDHNLVKQNLDTGEKGIVVELSAAAKLRWTVDERFVYYTEDAATVYQIPLNEQNKNVKQIANTHEKVIWRLIANHSGKQPELFLALIEQKNNMLLKLDIGDKAPFDL